MKLILGSGSPRRREILAQVGITPAEIRAPNIDETPLKKNYPLSIAEELPKKIQALELADDEIALCADTTVALGRRILGNLLIGKKRAVSYLFYLEDGTKLSRV